jgi:hypothetical protein
MQNTPTPHKLRFTVLAGMILAAAAFRILPHPPNFSPIAAIALFGGAQFASKRAAFLVPLAAMFLADLVLGLHSFIPVIYGCFALIVCLGFWLRRKQSPGRIVVAALVGSLLFFAITNFGVWAGTGMYPKTIAGLTECFVAALPFFQNTLTGDLFFNTVLFGGLALAEWRLPQLRESYPA